MTGSDEAGTQRGRRKVLDQLAVEECGWAVGSGGWARCDQANRPTYYIYCALYSWKATLLKVSRDMLQDCSPTMWGTNARLKGFLEQVNGLQEANRRLEAQVAEWGVRGMSRSQDWSRQEQTANELRAQVGKLLMENAQLALQSDSMKSRAAAIQARCETEEGNTRCLEQQVALLRELKRKADQSSVTLQADCCRSMTELQEMHQEFEAARALQLQRADSCDALLATAAEAAAAAGGRRGEEEDGTGMEPTQLLDRIRAQCDQSRAPGPGERHLGPGAVSSPASGAAASRTHRGVLNEEEAAWAQVSLGGAALREARAELAEARKQWHSLQVEIETLHALEKGLETSLQHTQRMYSSQLQDLSQVIAGLESELEQVRDGLATQRERHSQLLNTKMRLEREIATYRRLLEREEGRYMGRNGQPMSLRPWRSSAAEPKENGLDNNLSDPAVTPDEPKSEPLPEIPSLLPAENGLKKSILYRQQSLVILTEPEQDEDLPISTVKTQEILQGNVVQESAEGHGTIETEKIDQVIKQWEGSFFRGNPKLRKKSVSLRFDLHMAAADEGCAQTRQDSLPDVEVRLIMKRSRSIPTITP
ncbi:keratin, type I cytoskeletal 18-A [Brachyistius frenatus]|uniref:keratin, type I cytoskeletal 18-A n=1 Tax=Brachyistius frenatus TaxID=100188 RepID=UPI0037E82EBC